MKRFEQLPPPGWNEGRPVVATIGNFDAVHRGHQAILGTLIARARDIAGLATVITFSPHPQRILFPERAPHLMLTAAQKQQQFEAAGIDVLIVIPFDRQLAALEAEPFARDILATRIGLRELYVGPEFRFGQGRHGDVALLAALGPTLGFTARGVEPVLEAGERISASRIRRELTAGHVETASQLLGRPYSLVGTIVHGEGRGKNMLVPTANLAPENEFLPGHGVYITRFRRGAETIRSITNLGTRPTFGDMRVVVETYLPGFSGDLYGQRVELEFLQWVRAIRRFENPEELLAQIRQDLSAFETYWAGRTGT